MGVGVGVGVGVGGGGGPRALHRPGWCADLKPQPQGACVEACKSMSCLGVLVLCFLCAQAVDLDVIPGLTLFFPPEDPWQVRCGPLAHRLLLTRPLFLLLLLLPAVGVAAVAVVVVVVVVVAVAAAAAAATRVLLVCVLCIRTVSSPRFSMRLMASRGGGGLYPALRVLGSQLPFVLISTDTGAMHALGVTVGTGAAAGVPRGLEVIPRGGCA